MTLISQKPGFHLSCPWLSKEASQVEKLTAWKGVHQSISLTGKRRSSALSLLPSPVGQGVRLGFAPLVARSFPTQDECKEAMARFMLSGRGNRYIFKKINNFLISLY